MGFISEVVVEIVLVGAAFAWMMLTLLNSHLTKIRPDVNEAASEPNKTSGKPILEQHRTKDNSTAPTARSEEQVAFSNGGNLDIWGFGNQTGIVKGNGNGGIKGVSANDILIILDAVKSNDDGPTQNGSRTTPPTYHIPTTMPGICYNNSGYVWVRGLANQTGCIVGNDNGSIDCSSAYCLTCVSRL